MNPWMMGDVGGVTYGTAYGPDVHFVYYAYVNIESQRSNGG